jgi:hypothetical protein
MAEQLPGKGLFGWLGRQIGYVKKAIAPKSGQKVAFRQQHTEEKKVPDQPGVLLRRTVIDEVVVEPERKDQPPLDRDGHG